MLFLVHFEILPENRDTGLERLKKMGAGLPEKVKLVGVWQSVTLLEGWAVVDAEDATALGKHLKHWTDLDVSHVTPVLTPEEVLAIAS